MAPKLPKPSLKPRPSSAAPKLPTQTQTPSSQSLPLQTDPALLSGHSSPVQGSELTDSPLPTLTQDLTQEIQDGKNADLGTAGAGTVAISGTGSVGRILHQSKPSPTTGVIGDYKELGAPHDERGRVLPHIVGMADGSYRLKYDLLDDPSAMTLMYVFSSDTILQELMDVARSYGFSPTSIINQLTYLGFHPQ